MLITLKLHSNPSSEVSGLPLDCRISVRRFKMKSACIKSPVYCCAGQGQVQSGRLRRWHPSTMASTIGMRIETTPTESDMLSLADKASIRPEAEDEGRPLLRHQDHSYKTEYESS